MSLEGDIYGEISRTIDNGMFTDSSHLSGAPAIALAFCNQVFQVAESMLAMFPDRDPLPAIPAPPAEAAAEDNGSNDWNEGEPQETPSIPMPAKRNKK